MSPGGPSETTPNENSLQPKRPWIKEPFCGISHGLGILLGIAGLVALLILAQGRTWHVVGFAIYGASLIVLYTVSTLYHSLHVSPRWSDRLQQLDYSAIFLLIAGTYAPVCLVSLRGTWGWSLLAVEYGLAILGIGLVFFAKRAPQWIRVVLCVCMGWLALIAVPSMRQSMPPAAIGWLLAGGVVYSIGTIIYATDRPHLWPGKFSAHDLFHIFVLGGSACHFFVMLRFVAPLA
ncbi:MAG: hemolysin III family protein [Abitibacteriaceae bacterium]|nr:hemolysin III family protein [Abditibacteriaceae bacterium]